MGVQTGLNTRLASQPAKWELRHFYVSAFRSSFTVHKRWLLAVSQLSSFVILICNIIIELKLFFVVFHLSFFHSIAVTPSPHPFSSLFLPLFSLPHLYGSEAKESIIQDSWMHQNYWILGFDCCGVSWKYNCDARLKLESVRQGIDSKFLVSPFRWIIYPMFCIS